MTARSACHLLVAGMALAGIAISYADMAMRVPLADLPMRTVNFWSYFTILTNALLAAAAIGPALPVGRWHDWAMRPATRTAVTVYILVVAAIVQLLLKGLVPLTPLGRWGDVLVHEAVPATWLLCWLCFGPHGGIDRRAPWRWLGYPLLYGAWTAAHGAMSGFYPYPFLDVARLGALIAAHNMVLTGVLFALLGFALRWVDGRLADRAPA